jgi:hypothetical protein
MITITATKGSTTHVNTTTDMAHARVLAVYAVAMGAERCTVNYDGVLYDAPDFEKLFEVSAPTQG